jgi:N-acetylmuramoyl-L-alanine amidase
MKKNTLAIILTTAVILGVSAFLAVSQISKTKSISTILSFIHETQKIRVLIVPGHEPNDGGASYKGINERDLNLQLSEILKNDLSDNPDIEVILARDDNGWNNDLKNYVSTGSTTIMDWVYSMKNKMLAKANTGEIEIVNPDMKHNDATDEAVLYLYATNKWIADNNIDLVLNIHFNNNPKINGKPNYRGYCIYIPDKQYGNATSSRIFANYLNNEISKIENKSTMPQEKDTIIEDQQLIAIGNYDTLKIPSALVEYSYIYEPMMVSSSSRNKFISVAASATASAINNFIKNKLGK